MRGVALDGVALLALDADRDVTGDGHPVQAARQAVVVVDGVVLGDAVVEEDELVRGPAVAQDVLRPDDVRLEQVEILRDSDGDRPTIRWAKPPMNSPRSPVSGWTRTTGWTVRYLMDVNWARWAACCSSRSSSGTA